MSDEVNPLRVFDRAAEFVSEMWREGGPSSEMHVGDLVWGTFSRWPSAVGALRLWPDRDGQIQALTMFDGSGVCDLVVRPGSAGIAAAALALEWAESAAAAIAVGPEPTELRVGRRLQSIEVIELLHTKGFERRTAGVPAMSRTLVDTDVATPAIPNGYAIRELHPDDLASRVLTFNAAFPGEELSVDAYQALRASAPYRRALTSSLSCRRQASLRSQHCGWTHTTESSRSNQLVVTRTTVAWASRETVILQALRWSVELGATGALVRHVSTNTAAQGLYESCGFTTACKETGFTKTIL